jgi:hypothetical protein
MCPASQDLTSTKCSEHIESEPNTQSFVLRSSTLHIFKTLSFIFYRLSSRKGKGTCDNQVDSETVKERGGGKDS